MTHDFADRRTSKRSLAEARQHRNEAYRDAIVIAAIGFAVVAFFYFYFTVGAQS